MRVKVCGITNLEDALNAVAAGADALGFIFYPRSSRFITPEEASHIIEHLPPFIVKVGIFIDSDVKFINKAIAVSGISLAQIHFEAGPALYGSLIAPHLRVVRVQREEDVSYLSDQYRLVDNSLENRSSNEELKLEGFENQDCSKIILSGGLTTENVEKVLPLGLYGVDVNIGVEYEPGKKDYQKMKDFIRKVKQL